MITVPVSQMTLISALVNSCGLKNWLVLETAALAVSEFYGKKNLIPADSPRSQTRLF